MPHSWSMPLALDRNINGVNVMAFSHTTQRSSPRSFIVCPISLTFETGTAHGILRDISQNGMFFYSNFRPSLQSMISFSVKLGEKNISGSGEVIRVEQSSPGAAIGVAVRISSYQDSD